MTAVVELSADMGEGSPDEPELWPLLDAASVACGGHTGDEASMREAARLAREHGVRLGAHPSYPDREHFGRRSLAIEHHALRASLVMQIEALRALAPIGFVKPHGALYNDAHRDAALAAVVAGAIRTVDPQLALVAPAVSAMSDAARAAGLRVIREAFADRRYEPDGSLTPRGIGGATLTVDEAAMQAASLAATGRVTARDGTIVDLSFDTLCIHSDLPGALERVRAIRARLGRERYDSR